MKMDGITYRPTWRVAAAILVGASRGSLIAILVLLFFPDLALGLGSRLGNPLRLLRAFAGLCLAPAAAAWVLAVRRFARPPVVRVGASDAAATDAADRSREPR